MASGITAQWLTAFLALLEPPLMFLTVHETGVAGVWIKQTVKTQHDSSGAVQCPAAPPPALCQQPVMSMSGSISEPNSVAIIVFETLFHLVRNKI
ncbi:hypothetical protein CDAR_59721 [Caerostris darwini]|uniref:Secreted protein n=1 Tax=Caerostris darwini TaxID=1538125 RepID=A0AAV4RSB7_9ARAC|nr:hypothetical protein CDAR_59721 [Caerostris darwini]